MTNNTLQHGLSEIYIFLILGLDFIAAIAKTGPAFRKILVLSIIAFKILKDLTIKKVGKSCWPHVMSLSFPAYAFYKASRKTNKHLANWLNSRQNNIWAKSPFTCGWCRKNYLSLYFPKKIIWATFITVKKLPEHFLTRNLTVVYKTIIVITISLHEISFLVVRRLKTQMLKMQVPQHSTQCRLLHVSLNASKWRDRMSFDWHSKSCLQS